MWDQQTELDVVAEIYGLTAGAAAEQNWRKLLALGKTLDQQLKRKILWIWPNALDLTNLCQTLTKLNIQNVLSIGCGSGLLEWLMTAVSGNALNIYGLESDPNWWQSNYAVRSFIPLNYIEDAAHSDSNIDASVLSRCCSNYPPCALLFCYFNNRSAFLEYLRLFEGKWLIIIGPQPTLSIHTDPNPLQPHLPNNQWALREIIEWTEENVVVVYEKLPLS